MPCQRCQGLMVADHFIDMQDDRGHCWLNAWRCVNCGDVVEPGILRHKLEQRSRLAVMGAGGKDAEQEFARQAG